MDNRELLALRLISGLGDRSIFKIINRFEDLKQLSDADDTALLCLLRSNFRRDYIIGELRKLPLYFERAQGLTEYCHRRNIQIVGYNDLNYPRYLRLINDPPVLLFCRGNISLLENYNNAAVVGTRQCSLEGLRMAAKWAEYLVKEDYAVVSGLAMGIDTAAHETVLKKGGKAIGVVVDADSQSRTEGELLANSIIDKGGIILSENPPGEVDFRSKFVLRNRIQSGLSLGIVVIEAGVKGGTMHTAAFARKQGRISLCPRSNNISEGVDFLIKNRRALPVEWRNREEALGMMEDKKTHLLDAVKSPDIQLAFV